SRWTRSSEWLRNRITVSKVSSVLVRTREKLVTVDLADLGGVTVSVTPGTRILAVGTMEPSGEILHAKHLEPPASPGRSGLRRAAWDQGERFASSRDRS